MVAGEEHCGSLQYEKRGVGRTKQNKVIDFFFSFHKKKICSCNFCL